MLGQRITLIDRFVQLCELLKNPENHIRIRVQKHINPKTTAESINERAQELASLPRFTAYAKTLQVKGAMGEIELTRKTKIQTIKMPEPLKSPYAGIWVEGEVFKTLTRLDRAVYRAEQESKKRIQIDEEIKTRRQKWSGGYKYDEPPPTDY